MGKLWDILQRHIDSAPYPPSERQVAAKLGVSPTTLGNWREPRKLPSRENLQAIADLVGVRYAAVLDAALYDTGYHEGRQLPSRSRSEVEADLQVAEQDLAEYSALKVTGRAAESKHRELRARVDALKAELVTSRSATTAEDSVADS